MASAYRPRHKEKPKHQKQKKSISNKITNHLPTKENTHTYLTQIEKTTLELPNRVINNITITTPKIYKRINHIVPNISQYTPQYTSHHINHKYNLIQIYHVTSHPKHKLHAKPIHHPQYKLHPKSNTYLVVNPNPKLKTGLKCKPLLEPHRRCNPYRFTLYQQTNLHQTPRSHPKCNSSPHKYIYHLITTKKNHIHPTRHLNPNPKTKPKTQSKHNNYSQPYREHNHHTKNKSQQSKYTQQHIKMASAYRPRHKEKPKYKKLEKRAPKTTINHPPTNKSTHSYLTQLGKTTHILPNHLTTKVTTTTPKIYTKINTIIRNKIQYIPKYIPHYTKHKHSLLQKNPTRPQYKYHQTIKSHTKQKNTLQTHIPPQVWGSPKIPHTYPPPYTQTYTKQIPKTK